MIFKFKSIYSQINNKKIIFLYTIEIIDLIYKNIGKLYKSGFIRSINNIYNMLILIKYLKINFIIFVI